MFVLEFFQEGGWITHVILWIWLLWGVLCIVQAQRRGRVNLSPLLWSCVLSIGLGGVLGFVVGVGQRARAIGGSFGDCECALDLSAGAASPHELQLALVLGSISLIITAGLSRWSRPTTETNPATRTTSGEGT